MANTSTYIILLYLLFTGGFLCCIFGRKSKISDDQKCSKLSRSAVVTISFCINIVAYILIFINLPDNSPFGDTQDKSIIASKYTI